MDIFKFFGLVLIVVSIFGVSTPMHSSKALEGYSRGYHTFCPNNTGPIPAKDLNNIYLIVRGAGSSKKIRYKYNESSLLAKDAYMDWSKKTILYVAGFTGNPKNPDAGIFEALYLNLGYNVWLLDEFYFFIARFSTATRLTLNVGIHIGKMLAELTLAGVLDPSKLEMISISLGAHVMSFIAKEYYRLTGKKFGRLTGLDPTGACFRNAGPEERLDESDADFVDVVMTNIDGFGMAAPVGHVNFYVNGGEFQGGTVLFVPCGMFCSHMKSMAYWFKAMEHPHGFVGVKCDSVQHARYAECYDNVPQVTNIIGPLTDRSKPGIYYVPVRGASPFYLGKKGLRKKNDDGKLLMKHIQNVQVN